MNLSPGSSTRPTSDPGREPVFTGVQRQGPPAGSSRRVQHQGPATGWRAFSSKPVKWTIGRFYWLTRRTRSFLQLWRHGSDFLYTKNSAMGRSDCIYIKNSARPRSHFIYTKNCRQCIHRGTMRQKIAIFKKGNSFCRGRKNVMSFGSRHFTWFERCEVSHCTGQRDPCNG